MEFVSEGSIFYRNATYYCIAFYLQRESDVKMPGRAEMC